jgi:hypothetical protein
LFLYFQIHYFQIHSILHFHSDLHHSLPYVLHTIQHNSKYRLLSVLQGSDLLRQNLQFMHYKDSSSVRYWKLFHSQIHKNHLRLYFLIHHLTLLIHHHYILQVLHSLSLILQLRYFHYFLHFLKRQYFHFLKRQYLQFQL